jgi:hypothetical protein
MENEYCDQIKRVLREFECYDSRVFRDAGGYLAYTALEVLKASYGLTPLGADPAISGQNEGQERDAAQAWPLGRKGAICNTKAMKSQRPAIVVAKSEKDATYTQPFRSVNRLTTGIS